ncbi:hypothetical protein [Intrasporangium sp. YIM S08009]|uniref:BP74-related protein n=1 Tax=Intrasporangium zincisolvens TaxID=3080018 RepID=UPI002B05787F|nr:hypothetical protein [Intrasporangium sp. YIM S08009]
MGRTASATLAAVAALLLAGCGGTPTADAPPTAARGRGGVDAAAPAGSVLATFRVVGGETFRVELHRPDLVEHARRLLAGGDGPSVPIGAVVRDDPGPNGPWSWHLDPDSVEFAFSAVDACDGSPSDIENGFVVSPDYCPRAAEVVAVEDVR